MLKQGSWSIKTFLLAGSVAIVILLIVNISITQYVSNTKLDLSRLENEVVVSANTLLMIRRSEKDFISRIDPKYTFQVLDFKAKLVQQLTQIDRLLTQSNLDISYDNQRVLEELDDYIDTFSMLINEIYSINGTSAEQGLLARFEHNSNELQLLTNQLKDTELLELIIANQLTVFDFFKSFDSRLLTRITHQFKIIEQHIIDKPQSTLPLQQAFLSFEHAFFQLQSSMKRRGYSESLGYHGTLRQNVHSVERSLETLFNTIPLKVDKSVSGLVVTQSIVELLLVLLIIGILYYIFYAITRMEKGLIFAREKEQQANSAKSSFLANMSHEIRTPLNGIIGMTEILTDSKLSAIQKDYLATINSSSQTLLMLINDILDLSKIESGHLEFCPHTCNIKEVIYDTAALISPKAQQKNIVLRIIIGNDVPTYIYADEQKLRQILMNLASNAIKFTRSGSVSFKLVVKAEEGEDIRLLFSVKDTGVGIDKNKHAKIFEEFQQEESNTSIDYGGTGLGLSIATKMVKIMGGEIMISSDKGVGSEFYFILAFPKQEERVCERLESKHLIYCAINHSPLLVQNIIDSNHQLDKITKASEIRPLLKHSSVIVLNVDDISDKQVLVDIAKECSLTPILIARPNNSINTDFGELVAGYITLPLLGERLNTLIKSVSHCQKQEEDLVPLNSDSQKSKKIVLVVEDNKVNQQVVSINLKKLNLPYLIANDGREALEHYKRHIGGVSVILMDCMMPIMDGFEATRAIRIFEKEEGEPRVTIIALTASILDDDIQKCFESGMDDYLPKPFKRDVLVRKLAKQH